LTADSKAIVEGLFVAIQQELHKQVNDVLKPIEVFTKNFLTLVEKMPEDVKKDIQREFQEAKSKLEEEFKLLRESIPTFNNIANAIKTINENLEDITRKEIENFKCELTNKFKEILENMGFSEPEQMRLLAQLVRNVLPLLQELLRLQQVPKKKGQRGEFELLKEINEYFPEDECKYLGSPGE
jgi:uncharacterized protein with von Willebrand factor type A (vWA) domain